MKYLLILTFFIGSITSYCQTIEVNLNATTTDKFTIFLGETIRFQIERGEKVRIAGFREHNNQKVMLVEYKDLIYASFVFFFQANFFALFCSLI